MFIVLFFLVIYSLLNMFMDLSRDQDMFCLNMIIIFVRAFMEDLNARKNWNIQDWMYLARPTDNSDELLAIVVMVVIMFLLSEVSKYSKSGKRGPP